MRKYLFIFTAVILTSISTTSAQSIYYGPKMGMNISNLTHTSNAKSRVRGELGAFAGYQLTEQWAIQTEMLYSFQGSKIDGEKLTLNYLKIPVIGKLSLIENLNAEAGLSFNFITSARAFGRSIKGLNSFDLSIPIGASYRFLDNMEIGLRYDISLTNVDFPGSSSAKNSCWFINLANRF